MSLKPDAIDEIGGTSRPLVKSLFRSRTGLHLWCSGCSRLAWSR